jgi:hypothetical protein
MAQPINDEHALLCGMVWGAAIRAGLNLNPTQDDAGNYTDTCELILPKVPDVRDDVHIFLTVQPPHG